MMKTMLNVVIIARVWFGAFLLIGIASGQATSLTSGSTLVSNDVINALIRTLNHRPVPSPDQMVKDPLGTTSRSLQTSDAFIRQQKPIDELIEEAKSDSAIVRLADQQQMMSQERTVIEGDIVIDQSELADMDKQIRFDLMEDLILRRFPKVRRTDTALKDLIRALLKRIMGTAPVRRKRAAIQTGKWPSGQMGIRIASSGFTTRQKNRIAEAMNEISERTCICFNIVSRTQALQRVPHVRIVNGNGCSSWVGRNLRNQGGTRSQDLTLARGCRGTRIITHELLHAIGLFHEQSRPDRNRYVRVFLRNVEPGTRGNFRRYSRATIDSLGIPYDYRSIMHYGNRAFSRNGRYTIIPRPRENRRRYLDIIGKATEMSENDARAINGMYSCSTPIIPDRCADYPYSFQ
ncbi:low choriolytic enzyme-like [Pecten maximus]|uniref:low choriolytic enzyme-like n=1 Tax=Pecten maximus TaxID=6579 RepID=UPI001458D278|nr:low choriolytic enzyme-like [Pecten maximus]